MSKTNELKCRALCDLCQNHDHVYCDTDACECDFYKEYWKK